MDFELAHCPVRSLSPGAATEYREGAPVVNRGALRSRTLIGVAMNEAALSEFVWVVTLPAPAMRSLPSRSDHVIPGLASQTPHLVIPAKAGIHRKPEGPLFRGAGYPCGYSHFTSQAGVRRSA